MKRPYRNAPYHKPLFGDPFSPTHVHLGPRNLFGHSPPSYAPSTYTRYDTRYHYCSLLITWKFLHYLLLIILKFPHSKIKHYNLYKQSLLVITVLGVFSSLSFPIATANQ